MRLLPREEKFYRFFLEQSAVTLEAARLLHQGARQGNASLKNAAAEIVKLEARGDEISHEIFTKLNQTFITPIDPEDIHSLGSHLDDVLDGIEESAHRMVSYRIEPIPPTVTELCGLVERCAVAIEKAFQALNDNGPLMEHCIEINNLEDRADQIVRQAIADLFEREKDPIALIKLKEIYEFLEQTTDYAEDVADALQNVVVKNG
jgi:uncharacterized protein